MNSFLCKCESGQFFDLTVNSTFELNKLLKVRLKEMRMERQTQKLNCNSRIETFLQNSQIMCVKLKQTQNSLEDENKKIKEMIDVYEKNANFIYVRNQNAFIN